MDNPTYSVAIILYNKMDISFCTYMVNFCRRSHICIYCMDSNSEYIKAHGSELRGQEETGHM